MAYPPRIIMLPQIGLKYRIIGHTEHVYVPYELQLGEMAICVGKRDFVSEWGRQIYKFQSLDGKKLEWHLQCDLQLASDNNQDFAAVLLKEV